MYILQCMEQITSETLLYSAENSMTCGDLDRREIRKGGDMHVQMADSCYCAAETTAML